MTIAVDLGLKATKQTKTKILALTVHLCETAGGIIPSF